MLSAACRKKRGVAGVAGRRVARAMPLVLCSARGLAGVTRSVAAAQRPT